MFFLRKIALAHPSSNRIFPTFRVTTCISEFSAVPFDRALHRTPLESSVLWLFGSEMTVAAIVTVKNMTGVARGPRFRHCTCAVHSPRASRTSDVDGKWHVYVPEQSSFWIGAIVASTTPSPRPSSTPHPSLLRFPLHLAVRSLRDAACEHRSNVPRRGVRDMRKKGE